MDSDTQIFQELLAVFQRGPLSHRARLSVEVRDGIVTIAGRVSTLSERKTVERVAKRVNGIRSLILDIGAAARPLTTTDTPGMSRTGNAVCD